jgi:hypothetical protein
LDVTSRQREAQRDASIGTCDHPSFEAHGVVIAGPNRGGGRGWSVKNKSSFHFPLGYSQYLQEYFSKFW